MAPVLETMFNIIAFWLSLGIEITSRQFCTIGPGGIGVGLEWDGSQRDHPKPRPATPGNFFDSSLFLYQK